MPNDTTTQATLYRKLAIVAGAALTVEKDGKNKDQNYRYATPAAVMTALKPLLAEQKIAIIPHLVEFLETDSGQRSGGGKPFILNRVLMHYHIVDGESGEAIVVPWQGQAGTYGDDKGLAKAQTIALRTFLIQLFQIPAEDPDTDPDAKDARPDDRRPTRAAPATYTPPAEPVRKTAAPQIDPARATPMSDKQGKAIYAIRSELGYTKERFIDWLVERKYEPTRLSSADASAIIEALRAEQANPTHPQVAQPSLADEYDAIDEAPRNGAAGVGR